MLWPVRATTKISLLPLDTPRHFLWDGVPLRGRPGSTATKIHYCLTSYRKITKRGYKEHFTANNKNIKESK